MVCFSHFFKNFPQFAEIHKIKGFSVINEAEVDVFVEFPCFLHDPTSVSNLISGSSASLKPSLYIWKFLVHVLLKPSLTDFEHYLLECEMRAVVWYFKHYLALPFFGIRMKTPMVTMEFSKFADILSTALYSNII